MKFLEDRILKDGRVYPGHILKVDGFLNHQIDVKFLEEISEDLDVDDMEVAEDVQDIIDAWCEANDASIDDIDFSSLANVFAGTWVEQFKDEITEW